MGEGNGRGETISAGCNNNKKNKLEKEKKKRSAGIKPSTIYLHKANHLQHLHTMLQRVANVLLITLTTNN